MPEEFEEDAEQRPVAVTLYGESVLVESIEERREDGENGRKDTADRNWWEFCGEGMALWKKFVDNPWTFDSPMSATRWWLGWSRRPLRA